MSYLPYPWIQKDLPVDPEGKPWSIIPDQHLWEPWVVWVDTCPNPGDGLSLR